MSGRLSGKVALVTAAGQGIGRATAELFAAEGAKVIATDINETMLASLTSCETRTLDVTDAQQINTMADDVGAIDVLFNCAGYVHSGDILDCQEEEWEFALNLNVKSIFRMIKSFLPGMIENGGGSIINMSSVAGSVIGVPGRFAYCTTKGAVAGLSRSIATDFIKQGIRCNAICPGTVQSPSLDDRLRATGDYEKAKADFIARQPMGRVGKADEVAELALYLASDGAGFTTGQIHIIDGGWSNA